MPVTMAATASTPTTTPAAMPATLEPPELEPLVGCAPDADAWAGWVTTTVVWPALVTTDGLVLVGVRVDVEVDEEGDEDELSPPKVGTLVCSPVSHTV